MQAPNSSDMRGAEPAQEVRVPIAEPDSATLADADPQAGVVRAPARAVATQAGEFASMTMPASPTRPPSITTALLAETGRAARLLLGWITRRHAKLAAPT